MALHRAVLLGRVDGVRRTLGTRELELHRHAVDGDDRVGSGESSGSDHLQADTAAPEHGNGLPWLHPGDVPHRPHAGDDAAAEQRRLPQRKLVWEFARRPPSRPPCAPRSTPF